MVPINERQCFKCGQSGHRAADCKSSSARFLVEEDSEIPRFAFSLAEEEYQTPRRPAKSPAVKKPSDVSLGDFMGSVFSKLASLEAENEEDEADDKLSNTTCSVGGFFSLELSPIGNESSQDVPPLASDSDDEEEVQLIEDEEESASDEEDGPVGTCLEMCEFIRENSRRDILCPIGGAAGNQGSATSVGNVKVSEAEQVEGNGGAGQPVLSNAWKAKTGSSKQSRSRRHKVRNRKALVRGSNEIVESMPQYIITVCSDAVSL